LAWFEPAKLTLWIGAGFARYYAGLPVWNELLHRLCDSGIGVKERALIDELIATGRFTVAAELLTEIRSEKIIDQVCAAFQTVSRIADEIPIQQISPGNVITTNYDLILDHVFPDYRRLDPRHPIESIFSFAPKLIKMHGSIADPESIVLNTSSYARRYTKEFEWFLLHLFQNTTVLFIGAGLADAEPYMKYIRLLKGAGLRPANRPHYALLPFAAGDTAAETNKRIKDRCNQLGDIGIAGLPYVVEHGDHDFFDIFLKSLAPPKTNNAVARIVAEMGSSLEAFGPEHIGPRLFRSYRSFREDDLKKTPFLNLVTKFLRAIRERNRLELVRVWRSQIEDLLDHQERTQSERRRNTDWADSISQTKPSEVEKNKVYLYDVFKALDKRPK
jgi:hypothetical protein